METVKNGRASRSESGKKGQGSEAVATDKLVAMGDVIYIKLRSGSWWPAQVVDAKSVSESLKPSKKLAREVLVRVYGTYTYKYVDPIKCRSEFEVVLKNNNGSYKKILHEALEQDVRSIRARKSKRSSSTPKGTPSKSPAGKRKSDTVDVDQEPGTSPPGKSQELSTRRIRVMESLGLIAPPGSPFVRNGRNDKQSL